MSNSVYDINVKTMSGDEKNLSEYYGKVLLIVNTASKCGFTPQFDGLQKLYKKYSEKGLIVLGFPCNQFGNQDPKNDAEIKSFCSLNYGVTFPLFSKIEVNGENEHPLYKFLKSKASGFLSTDIKWNFTKFLIDKNGNVIKRFSPATKPEELEEYIQKLF